jgi:hypothetical protein
MQTDDDDDDVHSTIVYILDDLTENVDDFI